MARRTYEVRVLVRPSQVARVGESFIRAGCGGVEEREVSGGTWLVLYAGSRAEAHRLAALAGDFTVEIGEVAAGWETRFVEHLRPEPITDRIMLTPRGHETRGRAGVMRLWFEPGPVFGVGSHATTRLAARTLERECRERPGQSLLDVGTGTGVLAMVGAVSGAKSALGIDIDGKAVASARKNARLNDLGQKCRFSRRALGTIRTQYELVVANIETRVLTGLAPELLRVTSALLILTGILEEHADELCAEFLALGGRPKLTAREDGWALYEIRP